MQHSTKRILTTHAGSLPRPLDMIEMLVAKAAGEPIVVADMARLLGTSNIETPRMVIAIRAPGQARPYGLLVEALGDIPEVSRDRLLPIDGQHNPGGSALVEYAIAVAEPQDPMVMVLNTARLTALLRGEPLDPRVQAAA